MGSHYWISEEFFHDEWSWYLLARIHLWPQIHNLVISVRKRRHFSKKQAGVQSFITHPAQHSSPSCESAIMFYQSGCVLKGTLGKRQIFSDRLSKFSADTQPSCWAAISVQQFCIENKDENPMNGVYRDL